MIDVDRQYELEQALYYQAGEIDLAENITGASESGLPLSYRPKDRLLTRLRDVCPIDERLVEAFVLRRVSDMDQETRDQVIEGHKKKRAGNVLTGHERAARIAIMQLEAEERREAYETSEARLEAVNLKVNEEEPQQERTEELALVLV